MSQLRVSLGEVADFINGVAFKPEDWSGEGKRIIRIQNLNNPDKPYNYTTRNVDEKYFVFPGDLLVSWSASLGVFEWKGPDVALVNQHIFKVVPSDKHVDKNYLRHMLRDAITEMGRHLHGATMKHVNRAEFLATKIPLLPYEEQKRIAKILDSADALRARRRDSLAQLDGLLQSTFLDFFGDPVTNEKNWETVSLGDCLENIDSGWSPKCINRSAEESEWGVLKLGAVTKCVFDEREQKALPPSCEPRPSIEVQPGDLLFSRKNTRELVGAAAYVFKARAKLMLSDLVFRLKIRRDAQLCAPFLWQLLINPRQRKTIQSLAGGAAGSMPNISKSKLKGVSIILPPIELQEKYARVVQSIENNKGKTEAHLRELDALFYSLQSSAFSGEL